jgi:hypothetical protein
MTIHGDRPNMTCVSFFPQGASAAKTDKEEFVRAHFTWMPTAKTIDPSTGLRYPQAGDGSWITEKSTCTQ